MGTNDPHPGVPPDAARTRRAAGAAPSEPGATVAHSSPVGFLPPPPGTVIEQRYRLDRLLGQGTFGSVHRAADLLTGDTVAIKFMRRPSAGALGDWRREVATLRRAHFPGVVRLLDDGVLEDVAFIVLALAEGLPFPGVAVPAPWEAIAYPCAGLLEALDRLHWAGLVHRDLKPENILVDASGRPTIVDLGIAWDEATDASAGGPRLLAGTPAYLAPELFTGQPPDAASDLYSLGVMLFEALTGRPPQPLDSLVELHRLRTREDAPPLLSLAPDTPEHVALTVDLLLRRLPEARPRTAGAVLALLRGDEPPPGALHDLPALGDGAPVAALLAAARAGRSLHIHGPRRAGRTRALFDAARDLVAEGRPVRRTLPGIEPLWSLRSVLGELPGEGDDPERRRIAAERLRALLREGCIVIADDLEHLDPASRAILLDARGGGVVLGSSREPEDGSSLPLVPVPEEGLRVLFAGPRRILHIPEDAARALHRRTGGWPGRVVDELEAWVRAGLARGEGGRVVMERAAVERLEVHSRPLAAPPDRGTASPGDGGAAAPAGTGDGDGAPGETAGARAAAWIDRGRAGQAMAFLTVELAVARDRQPPDPEILDDLVVHLLQAALGIFSGASVDNLLHQLGRLPVRTPTVEAVDRLARAAAAGHRGNAARALRSLEEPLPVDNPLLERWRHAIRVVIAQSAGDAAMRSALLDLHRWVRLHRSRDNRRLLASWLGWWRYRRLRFRGAARMHRIAARLTDSPVVGVLSLADAATAALDGFDFDGAIELAGECLRRSADLRSMHAEARAEWILRSARYRRGDALDVDEELLEAVARLGVPYMEALVLQNESALAWRTGQRNRARVLAARGSRLAAGAGREPVAMLLRTLAVASGDPLGPDEAAELAARVSTCSVPGIAAQGAALLASASPKHGPAMSAVIDRCATTLPRATRTCRREILSLDEALQGLDPNGKAPGTDAREAH